MSQVKMKNSGWPLINWRDLNKLGALRNLPTPDSFKRQYKSDHFRKANPFLNCEVSSWMLNNDK